MDINSNNYNKVVNIFCENISYNTPKRTLIKSTVVEVVRSEKKIPIEINIILTDDETMLGINKEYLNHDTYTDTITFTYSENPKEVWGDIYICLDRVRENAKTYKCKLFEELLRIVIHGTLHLCGYVDKEQKDERDEMIDKQEKYLKSSL